MLEWLGLYRVADLVEVLMQREDLTEPELLVWEAFPTGGLVDLRSGDPCVDDPANGGDWDGGRVIRSEVIRAILLGIRELEPGAVAALRLVGARISGCLDLVHAEVRFPVHLENCSFEATPDLRWAVTRYLDLSGSHLPGLMADDLRVEGQLVLRSCQIGALSTRPRRRALSATGLTVSDGVFMNGGFMADGEVRLLAGYIGGVLDLDNAQIHNDGGLALLAARLTVDGPVFCRNGFHADGEVVFRRAHITAFFDLSGAHISNPGGRAFFAPVLRVDSGIFCRESAVFTGEVILEDAHISGGIDLSGARLDNPDRSALSASQLTVDGPLFFRDEFTARGELALSRAHVSSFIDLEGARLSNPDGYALFAPGITVEGGMSFRDGTILDGQVSLESAQITGDLDLTDGRFDSTKSGALNCAHLVASQLVMPQVPVRGPVNLSHARISTLTAHPDSSAAGINVSELTYETLTPMLPAAQRIKWITSAHPAYLPQPYEQLAASYRQLGHDADARTVLLAKQRHRHNSLVLPLRLWGLLQDVTIGYGYRPGRAGLWLTALVTVGTISFGLHHPPPAQNGMHVEFNPFFYTLDLLMPVISYGQRSLFAPAGAYQWLSYSLISAGWILATTIITGISRALNRN